MSEEESKESKAGREFNDERKKEQGRRNDALNKKAAEEYEIDTTRDANEPNKPSGKGGYKRRRRSTKRRRRSSRKRRRTMRR